MVVRTENLKNWNHAMLQGYWHRILELCKLHLSFVMSHLRVLFAVKIPVSRRIAAKNRATIDTKYTL